MGFNALVEALLVGSVTALVVAGVAFAAARVRGRSRPDHEGDPPAASAPSGGSSASSPGLGSLVSTLVRGSVGLLAGLLLPVRELSGLADAEGRLTLLFSDIEASTAINLELGDRRWTNVLAVHDRVSQELVRELGGKVLKRQGDGFMAVLPSATAGLEAAVRLREALRYHPDIGRHLPLRIGVHTGEVIDRGDDIFGANVALAARVADAAKGDEILLSADAAEQLDPDARALLGRARKRRLKGLPGTHRLYRVAV